jgi:rod shape determining protein RodA
MRSDALSLKDKLSALSGNLLFIAFCLCFIGVILLYSAANGNMDPWASRQLQTIIIFIPLMLLLMLVDLRVLHDFSYHFYFLCLILLVVAEILGHKAMGAQRWIRLGPFNLQPSEITKIAVILVLSRYYHNLPTQSIGKISALIQPIILVLLPAILILKQPNLGTTMLILLTAATMFFVAGVRKWKFILVAVLAIGTTPIIWHKMHDYQKQRVLTFLDPERDPLGKGYNILQSKIAVGSGGMTGKGFLNGTQSQLNFLPEKHTDFIFTLLAEEFGFVGCVMVMCLLYALILYGYYVAVNARLQFTRLLGVGVASIIFFQSFINIAMISGVLPVVGLPLPFISYGGSNLLAMLMALGILMNAYINISVDRL